MSRGLIAGSWDLFHPGHVYMFDVAGALCDQGLMIALHTDPSIERPAKHKPLQTTLERFIQVKAHKCVAGVIPYDTEADLVRIMKMLEFEHYFIGDEHEIDMRMTGWSLLQEKGVTIHKVSRSHGWSSSSFRDRLLERHFRDSASDYCEPIG